jgi:hypothetical protein
MNKSTIDDLFEGLKDQFDIETPKLNHEKRFLEKLNSQQKEVVAINKNKKSYWKPLLAVAASVVLIITLFVSKQSQDISYDLASVSPEMAETQSFFTSTIEEELSKLKNETSIEAKTIINDAIKRISLLEREYESLKQDLESSGNDKRVIYAMISNFQNRIDILQTVLLQIENVKQLQQKI